MKHKMYFGEFGRWVLFLWLIAGIIVPAIFYWMDKENAAFTFLMIEVFFWIAFAWGYIEGYHNRKNRKEN